ncbi:alpha/beta fold hydrolase [[Eubacterium] cellulosolvens]
MQNLRKYGNTPFIAAVLHGGPGAPGELAPVAEELSNYCGVLEPLQSAKSLAGQVQELRTVLENHAEPPVTLLGFSWGAMLGFILAAQYPSLVKKLILIGSGVYEERYASGIMEMRSNRLSEEEKLEVLTLMEKLNDPDVKDKDAIFARFGNLMSKADSFDPLTSDDEEQEFQFDVYQNVWKDAEELRRSGKLLELGKQIKCPVLALHGDYDTHPADGVQKPLSSVVQDFRFILLPKCGHRPWLERKAKKKFYEILKEELLAKS